MYMLNKNPHTLQCIHRPTITDKIKFRPQFNLVVVERTRDAKQCTLTENKASEYALVCKLTEFRLNKWTLLRTTLTQVYFRVHVTRQLFVDALQ